MLDVTRSYTLNNMIFPKNLFIDASSEIGEMEALNDINVQIYELFRFPTHFSRRFFSSIGFLRESNLILFMYVQVRSTGLCGKTAFYLYVVLYKVVVQK